MLIFSVLTFNIWGLPFNIAKYKKQRVSAIANRISTSDYDVVCLQEVWCNEDFDIITDTTKSKYPYTHYFYSGVIGSGLAILSKWPIRDTLFHQWPLNGYIHMIHHGDWFGGKGVGLAVIEKNGVLINVYTTHLHAQYNKDCDSYKAHRVVQALDTALFIRLTSGNTGSSKLSILAGDLNSEPGDVSFKLIQQIADLKDSYVAHSEESGIGTNECYRNSFKSCNSPPLGHRIDYILFRSNSELHIRATEYRLPFPDKIPGKEYSFSDHEAVEATLINQIGDDSTSSSINDSEVHKIGDLSETVRQAVQICHKAGTALRRSSWKYLHFGILLTLFLIIIPLKTDFLIKHSLFYYIVIILIIILSCYLFIMATIWHKFEINAIFGAFLRLNIVRDRIERRERETREEDVRGRREREKRERDERRRRERR